MATLAEVAREEPEIAAVASRLWPGPLALQSVVPRPAASPPSRSPTSRRFVVMGRRACIRAMARDITTDAVTTSLVQAVVERSGVGGVIESVRREPLFELDIEQVDVASWVDVGQPGTHAVRWQWRSPV